jgi:hypothetical protein
MFSLPSSGRWRRRRCRTRDYTADQATLLRCGVITNSPTSQPRFLLGRRQHCSGSHRGDGLNDGLDGAHPSRPCWAPGPAFQLQLVVSSLRSYNLSAVAFLVLGCVSRSPHSGLSRSAALRGITAGSVCRVRRCRSRQAPGRLGQRLACGRDGRLWHLCSASGRAHQLLSSLRSYYLSSVGFLVSGDPSLAE